MKQFAKALEKDGPFFVFDQLTVEVHIWKVIRDSAAEIRTWQLIYINPVALKTWGFDSLEQIAGKTTDEIFGSGASEHYLPVVNKIMSEGHAHTYRDYFEHLDKHFRFTSIPFGEYFITTGYDISDFIQQQESVDLANQELDRLVKERTDKLLASEEELRVLNIIEKEKEKIYLATMRSAQHIMLNLLNQLQLVDLEIKEHPNFDSKVYGLFQGMLNEAKSLMEKLSSIERIDHETIRKVITPQ